MTTAALRIHALLKVTSGQTRPVDRANATDSRWVNLRRRLLAALSWLSVRNPTPSEQAMSDLSPLDRPQR